MVRTLKECVVRRLAHKGALFRRRTAPQNWPPPARPLRYDRRTRREDARVDARQYPAGRTCAEDALSKVRQPECEGVIRSAELPAVRFYCDELSTVTHNRNVGCPIHPTKALVPRGGIEPLTP
jgi:hypothetical protein